MVLSKILRTIVFFAIMPTVRGASQGGLFYGIYGTDGINGGAERVSLENLRNLRKLGRRYRIRNEGLVIFI